MNILAIDPANRTGFAHSDGYRGVIDLVDRFDKHPGDRLRRLWTWLHFMISDRTIELLASEDATFGSHHVHVQSMHNELRGVLKLFAAERQIDIVLFNPATIKAFATGSGRAKKPQMIAACKFVLGIETDDDNLADALFILELAKQPKCWPEKKLTKVERRKKVAKHPKLF